MDVLSRMDVLDNAANELWQLVYKINPGLAEPKTTATQELQPAELSLSEFFRMLPERISTATGSIREATDALQGELY